MLGPTPAARAALERARAAPLSYDVRALRTPDDRWLIVLGEAHLKFAAASALGKEIVSAFDLRGVETFQTRKVFGGRALWVLIHVPRLLLRALSLGTIKGSTITDAKELKHGHTYELESVSRVPLALHVGALYLGLLFFVFWSLLVLTLLGVHGPLMTAFASINYAFQLHLIGLIPAILLRRHRWSWLFHPAAAILTVRDAMMAEGTIAMLSDHPGTGAAVVVLGRAHSAGYERELIERFGFKRVDLSDRGSA
jgi:hypothetical protein